MHCLGTRQLSAALLACTVLFLICAGACGHGLPRLPSFAALLADPAGSDGGIPDAVVQPDPGVPSDGDWEFSGDNIYRLDGNVGIGKADPTCKLDVLATAYDPALCAVHPRGNQCTLGGWEYAVQANGVVAGGWFEGWRGLVAYGDDAGALFDGDTAVKAYGITEGLYSEGDTGVTALGITWGVYSEGNIAVEGSGTEAGGHFKDSDGSGEAWVGHVDRGISAIGDECGGYFTNTGASAKAYLASVGFGIEAEGAFAGGRFKSTVDSGDARVAYQDFGIHATGDECGGYFADSNSSGVARLGAGDYGIRSHGNEAGGYFKDEDGDAFAYVAYGDYKIYGNGQVSFVQNHPENPDHVIVYSAPEGDEAATYTRGTARLVNGVARVPLGETFKWVTNPDIGLTAHLTPRGEWADLYTVSLTTEELVVASRDPASNAAFDYIVYGLRIGFEEVSVVQEKDQEACIPSMEHHYSLYDRRPELRWYNPLERFERMRAAAGETESVDMSASHGLRGSIAGLKTATRAVDIPTQ